jgi:hypothetical protein
MTQVNALISTLINRKANLDVREEAATELWAFDEIEAEQALISVVIDHDEEELIADSAGEALWIIWSRKKKIDQAIVDKMHPTAKKFFL